MSELNTKDQIECKKTNCPRKPFFVKLLPTGERRIYINAKHDNKKHVYELTWEEVKEIFGRQEF